MDFLKFVINVANGFFVYCKNDSAFICDTQKTYTKNNKLQKVKVEVMVNFQNTTLGLEVKSVYSYFF